MSFVLASMSSGKYITYERQGMGRKPENMGKAKYAYDPRDAYKFSTNIEAEMERSRLKKIAKNFNVIEVDEPATENILPRKNNEKKRKQFSKAVRREVYRKTEGRCYICGDFLDFEEFEIEHRIPLACGGTNEISNLYCACHMCNTMKNTFPYSEMLIKAKKIVEYHKEDTIT